jgi:chemotaxis protein CheD
MSGHELGYAEHLAGNRYFDRKFDSEAVKVLPGEYFVTATNMLMVTVLGSCVSACIRDREKGIGGMNHFMLADSSDASAVSSSARYGTYAMEILINHLMKLGARKQHLEAKVFGGGRVMEKLTSSQVGERNAKFVIEFLKTEGIPVSAQDMLDVYPRKVYFFPHSGKVLVKRLIRMHNDTLVRREKEYAARLTEAPVAGDIELF